MTDKKTIYGVDLNKSITPLDVRNAIIDCFQQAHCLKNQMQELEKNEESKENYCYQVVKKAFRETGGNFDKPNKESLLKVIEHLAEFSSNFIDNETVEKHVNEISSLINRL